MTTITGSNGSDLLTGTAGSDTINSGNGDDTVSGGAGSDSLNGGAGSDTLDGGSGSDQLNGGSGSDTLIYNVSENIAAGTKDVYTGGAGVDTLQLQFTRAQWLESSTQTQIAAYLAHLAAVTNAKTGEVSNASASDFVFRFGSSTLTVQMTETLAILVDGVEMNPANEAVNALGDAATTTEDGPGIQIHVLQNDSVPDLVKSLAMASAPAHGTVTLVQPAMGDPSTWYFQYQPHATDFQYLAAGESATDTFSYEVTDADGGTGLATVTVTITGSNDGPVITAQDLVGAVTEQVAPAGTLSDSGVIGFSDLDLSDVHLVSATGTPVGSVLGSLTAVKDGDTTGTGTGGQLTWTYTVDATAVEYLAAGETRVESFTITVDDQHGGIVTRQIDVTITGTNDAPTIGAADAAAAVTEDAAEPTLSDSGTITFDDVDLSDAHGVSVAVGAGNTLGGVLTADVSDAATGAGDGTVNWTYSVANAATQYLAQDQTATETFIVSIDDGHGGTAQQQITVTVTGTNDVPVIGGVACGAVTEDDSAPNLSTSGALTITDIDQGQSNFAPQASVLGSSGYGSFALAADGNWTYTANNGQVAIQQLGAGQSISDSFTAVSSDGSASQVVTVTITGTNDVPVIGGVASGAVSEDDSTPNLSTSGALTIADVDAGQSSFTAQPDTAGSNGYGSFTLAADGNWTYTANNSQAAIQQLGAGESISDSFTAVSSDGTASQLVTVTITGTNDVPVIAGVASGAVQEDVAVSGGSLAASGALTIADVDADQSNFAPQASTGGSSGYGSFTLAADGTWTYAADNNQNAIQQLGAGQSISDSFTAVSSDGAASQLVTVTITGTNDVPVIGGVASGAVTEDASTPNLSTSGALTIADVDAGQSSFVPQVSTAGSNGYGSFNLLADGNWTYTANNSQAAIQQLAAGQSFSDSFTAVSSDGTASQLVTVTIAGTNDAPVLSAAATPALASVDQGAGAPAGAVGTLVSSLVNLNPPSGGLDNVSDADNGATTGIALTGANAVNGSWWYSTDGGTNWVAVGAVSDASALLLAADANTRVYFQANSNFSGTVSDGITFRAWDQTSGTAGTTVSTVTNGGSSAFSSATDTASITVNVVNVNPVTASDVLYVSNNTAVTLSTSVLLANDTDIDGAALSVTAISVVTGALATPIAINADGTFSFTTGATGGTVGSPTVVTLSYTLSDGAGGSATGSVTLNVLDTTSGANTVDLTGVSAYQGAYIDGKTGGDTLRDGAFQAVLVGSNGNDQLFGNAGSDLLIGGENVDTLDGGAGNDVLRGGNNNDEIDGGAGTEDLIDFSDGLNGIAFTLTQSSGNTVFNGPGSLGNDTYRNIEGVIGTAVADTLTGSASNDVLRGGGGNDTLDGAGGAGDLLDFSDGTAGLVFTLTQSSSTTSFNASAVGLGTDGYKNFEGVIGTAFADAITGSALNDQLRGGGGNDVINGLAGDDRIAGGTGADILTGGADNDTFVFDSAPNAVDSVTDFNASGSAASGDLVELSLGTFTALSTASGSTLSAAEFASSNGGGAGDAVGAGVHVIYDSATGNLYYDADGLSAANRTLVATLTLSNPADTFDSNDIKVGQ
ncbi:beta strand repeat-containing protein [Variovorax sp. AFSI2.2]|uniref:beta strand repeat-containing protein n=1 Tax=Variovorax sp. AFSI2.2 TaxID=3384160 RepID=UPI003EBBBF50